MQIEFPNNMQHSSHKKQMRAERKTKRSGNIFPVKGIKYGIKIELNKNMEI